jgi:hypothetical protein
MKIETKIYCSESKDLDTYKNLGIDIPDEIYNIEEDFVFELNQVVAIREVPDDKDQSGIYFKTGQSFIIAMNYLELKKIYLNV